MKWPYISFLNLLVGLAVVGYFGYLLPEFVPVFSSEERISGGDITGQCLALMAVCGFLSGLLIVATGVGLLIPRFRFTSIIMIAAGCAETAMAAISLFGALLGQSRGGMTEAWLMVLFLPVAVVLLLLTISGAFR